MDNQPTLFAQEGRFSLNIGFSRLNWEVLSEYEWLASLLATGVKMV